MCSSVSLGNSVKTINLNDRLGSLCLGAKGVKKERGTGEANEGSLGGIPRYEGVLKGRRLFAKSRCIHDKLWLESILTGV